MRVRVIKAFVARVDGNTFRGTEGQEIELPKGVDWLKAGFVEPVESKETATSKRAKSRETR